jgi:NAD(P)-dependent dehydrogenase (short-subunit alcohol dehydrogenase family)
VPRCVPAKGAVSGDAEPPPGADRDAAEQLTGAVPARPLPRVALVTGAGRRIGRALALALAEDGFAVAVHYHRSRAAAENVVAAIRAQGGKALAFNADLAQEDEVSGLVPQVDRVLGPIGCLVNNASVFDNDTVATASRNSWDRHLAVNLRAPFVLIQDMAARLPAEAGGVVVNMLDQRVWALTPCFVSYTLSKTGLWTLTRTMALALAPRIRVNGIGPGPTLPSARQGREQFLRQRAEMPLKRGTSPEEIAAALRFILSAPAMTGQMIALDGGQHLGWAQPQRPPATE